MVLRFIDEQATGCWDACTGWGSIRGSRLYAALASLPITATAIAADGDFGQVCLGSWTDLLLTLEITGVTSSSSEFLVPEVGSYPLAIGPGGSVPLPIRSAPTSPGAKSATVTVWSSDPSGPHTIAVSGEAPCPRPCPRLTMAAGTTADTAARSGTSGRGSPATTSTTANAADNDS